uniref:Uncharacterized protein n=1 Tax=Anguilla anguilla TaxID=7936 RepID=A0A0E9VNE9_ANGAN
MHSVSSEQPVMEWSSSTAGQPVLSVQWGSHQAGGLLRLRRSL